MRYFFFGFFEISGIFFVSFRMVVLIYSVIYILSLVFQFRNFFIQLSYVIRFLVCRVNGKSIGRFRNDLKLKKVGEEFWCRFCFFKGVVCVIVFEFYICDFFIWLCLLYQLNNREVEYLQNLVYLLCSRGNFFQNMVNQNQYFFFQGYVDLDIYDFMGNLSRKLKRCIS